MANTSNKIYAQSKAINWAYNREWQEKRKYSRSIKAKQAGKSSQRPHVARARLCNGRNQIFFIFMLNYICTLSLRYLPLSFSERCCHCRTPKTYAVPLPSKTCNTTGNTLLILTKHGFVSHINTAPPPLPDI